MNVAIRSKSSFLIFLLIIGIIVFYLATIRQGHNWGDDFSQYIIHARNIVHGVPYKQTGHIINKVYNIAPETYPPVFPLLLAPVYYFFGLNLYAFKVVCVLVFGGFLLSAAYVFRNYFDNKASLVLLGYLGLNPYIWDFKDSILSEFPFLFFVFTAFAVVFAIPTNVSFLKGLAWYALAGLVIYLAIGCRSIGIILLPAFIVHELFRKPKAKFWYVLVLVAVAVCGGLLFLQKFYLNSTGEGYITQLKLYFRADLIINNLKAYQAEFANFIAGNEVTNPIDNLTQALFLIMGIAALCGFIIAIIRKITIVELFGIAYLLAVLLWPMYQGMRLLLPIAPLVLLYVMVFVQRAPFYKNQLGIVFKGLFGLIMLGFMLFYREANFRSVKWNLYSADTKDLFSFVSYTPEEAIFLFEKPRALTLFTGRIAGINHCTDNPADLGTYIKEIKASYLIINRWDQSCASKFVTSTPEVSQKVFENNTYVVYKFSDDFIK